MAVHGRLEAGGNPDTTQSARGSWGLFCLLPMSASCNVSTGFPGIPGLTGLNGLPGTKGSPGTPGKSWLHSKIGYSSHFLDCVWTGRFFGWLTSLNPLVPSGSDPLHLRVVVLKTPKFSCHNQCNCSQTFQHFLK